ncbi:Fe-S protein [Microbacterium sp. zg.B48]|uniref:Fe-S protein n=1 Tax=unclassified Microbacterium TaxID=2609290 RepID=UPI00214BE05B|nr:MULTISPECIES: Fe-S protein [unclassified Microbacterium]MCR2763993.1 Fe-S protein [Microbacterium sp. zg.B48]MCR2810414.1 Fe-S protein [Microbacterium sp. zg.B185]WIM18470.1 Fe-S protein [Microbacterium sp. zg-B185]
MDALEVLRQIVVLIHLSGFAVLFGAWAVEVYNRRVQTTSLMSIGLTISFVAGLILAAPWGISYDLNYVKIGVKLVVLIIIGALLGIGSARERKGGSIPPAAFWLVGILTLLNAGIALLWR